MGCYGSSDYLDSDTGGNGGGSFIVGMGEKSCTDDVDASRFEILCCLDRIGVF